MKVSVCVGSSCHLKGSYDVIVKLQELIKKYGVEDKVELAASFCLGQCIDGVCAKSEDGLYLHKLSVENAEDIFVSEVLPRLN